MMHKLLTLLFIVFITGCSSMTTKEMATVDYVDLERFMGDWYVIANIPTFIEKDAYNAVESYELNENGEIDTTFTFNKGSFDGERKEYHPTGYVKDNQSNAIWGMQFLWPFKADFRIIYLSEDYSVTIIGRNKRDYVWLMAREPFIPEKKYNELIQFIAGQGYDVTKIKKVPQQKK